MEPNSLKWVGSPCGLHGPYIFYKAFRFHLEDKSRILSLGDFFFVRCKPEDPICIAELQLLWEERTTKQLLSSSKLYFLPEDTPQGRSVSHGEDEIVAVSEKVIVKLDDLVKWTVSDFSRWKCGLRAVPLKPAVLRDLGRNGQSEALQKYRESTLNSGLNFKDVLKEKAELGEDGEERKVLVLSYPQYCRYRSVMARLRERPSSLLTDHVVLALGGIASLGNNTKILYCRDTFDHPTLIENESVCDEFAPNLKGRPRKKKTSISLRRDSLGQSSGKEASNAEGKAPAKVKTDSKVVVAKPKNNGSCKKAAAEEKPKVGAGEECRADEQAFLVALYKYMKERKTPIERIPYLGFKQINLWTMFQAAQKLGGYELITARRQWKNVYDELGGNPGSTSAATCTRRHYERLILPYERHTKGEEDKPLPPVKPRKQEAGAQEGGGKTKVTAVKRPREEQNQKPKNEKDEAVKGLELSPVPDEERSSETSERQQEAPALKEERKSSVEEEEEEEEEEEDEDEDEELQFTVEEEALGTAVPEKPPHRAPPWEDGPSERVLGEPPPPPPDELQEEAGDELPTPKPPHRCPTQDRGQDSAAEPGVTGAVVNVEDAHNHVGTVLPTPKQRPLQAPPARDLLSEMKEVVIREEPCFGYTPVLYPRGNPGIMSPLAKKKMLSQVSGTTLPNNYSFGPPPPLMNNRCANGSAEELTGGPGPQGPQGPGAETLVVNRPSVIQHAQSFKPRGTDNRKDPSEPPCAKLEHFACNPAHAPPQPHPQPSPTGDPYLLRADPHNGAERVAEKKARPSQAPSFLCDFYSSPHLHSLYRQTEHHLSKEQLTKYLSRELPFPRDGEGIQGYPPAGHPENHGLSYGAQLSQKDKATTGERSTDDQPTDLSLPKLSPHKLPGPRPSLCRAMSHSMTQQDVCTPPLFQVGNGQTSGVDYHPRACRVQPMTMSAPKKHMDPSPRAGGKLQNGRADDVMGYKVEEMSRPILSAKSGPHNVCAARPLKRSPEEPENGPPEKKIRVVTPMHSAKDVAGRTRTPDAEGEVMMKPAEPMHGVHVNSYAEGHKYPLHSHIFPGLYPGAFVSQVQDVCDSMGSHLPAGYSHPLQYLKNQAVISPLMPPFAIHSFMMQRQLLASTAGPPHLYRHPAGPAYGDFLHHGLYPMSALNPQAAFSPSQLASVHPSTKLS